jgi:hypothetical protein
MSVENHYMERIALATEQTARDMKKLLDILGKLSLQLEDTQKRLNQITAMPDNIVFNDHSGLAPEAIKKAFEEYVNQRSPLIQLKENNSDQ